MSEAESIPVDVPGGPPEGDPSDSVEEPLPERTYPSTIGGAIYLVVLLVAAVALVVVWLVSWRTGIRIFGGVLVVAAGVRLLLGDRDAGMLAVRHKAVDATLLTLVGAVMLFLASSIPDQPV